MSRWESPEITLYSRAIVPAPPSRSFRRSIRMAAAAIKNGSMTDASLGAKMSPIERFAGIGGNVKIKHGLISADSHIVLDKDAFLRHMPSKWGDLIPQVRETEVNGRNVERWFVHNQPPGGVGGVVNAPAVMGNRDRTVKLFAERWEEV